MGGWFRPEYDNAFNYAHSIELPDLYFKGALALADNNFNNIRKCSPATVKSLYCEKYPQTLFDNIIRKIFHNIILFDAADFRLRPLGDAMLGALIMYHPRFLEDYGFKNPIVVEFYKVLKYFRIQNEILMQWSSILQSRWNAEMCASSNEHLSAIETLTATSIQLQAQVAELLKYKQDQEKVNRTVLSKLDEILTCSTPQKRRKFSPGSPIFTPTYAFTETVDQAMSTDVAAYLPVFKEAPQAFESFDCSGGLAGVTLWGVIEANVQGQTIITKDKNDKCRIDRTVQFIQQHLAEQFNQLRGASRAPEDRASLEWSVWAKQFKEAGMKLQADALKKLNEFEREANEKETKSYRMSTFAQSIGRASVKAKVCKVVHLERESSSIMAAFLIKKMKVCIVFDTLK